MRMHWIRISLVSSIEACVFRISHNTHTHTHTHVHTCVFRMSARALAAPVFGLRTSLPALFLGMSPSSFCVLADIGRSDEEEDTCITCEEEDTFCVLADIGRSDEATRLRTMSKRFAWCSLF
jgi:hypothetical protein